MKESQVDILKRLGYRQLDDFRWAKLVGFNVFVMDFLLSAWGNLQALQTGGIGRRNYVSLSLEEPDFCSWIKYREAAATLSFIPSEFDRIAAFEPAEEKHLLATWDALDKERNEQGTK